MESTRNSSLIVGCAAIAVLAVCALAAAVLFGPQTIGSEGASHAQTSVSASLTTPSVKLLRVRQDYLYSLFFGGKFKKWFALLFSTHYMWME